MKILILSDSHSTTITEALPKYSKVIHCGDYGRSFDLLNECNVTFVRGNCDWHGEPYQELIINDNKCLVTHGHLLNVKYGYDRLIYKALEANAKIVFFGHTHNPTFFEEEGIKFINPGAYEDGNYAILTDDEIIFHKDNKVLAKYEIKW